MGIFLLVNKKTMKLSQIVDSKASLEKLAQTTLPIKIAYRIGKIISQFNPELELFEEQRQKLVKQYGECLDEKADRWEVKPELKEDFFAELDELKDAEVEVGFSDDKPIKKIKVSELGDISLQPAHFVNLDWLFDLED